MKNFESMGVRELDTQELKTCNGGNPILALFIIIECIGLVIAGYFAAEEYL